MPTPTNRRRRVDLAAINRELNALDWDPPLKSWVVSPTPSPATPQAPRDTPDRSGESAEQALEAMQ